MSVPDAKGASTHRVIVLFISFIYITVLSVSVFYTLLDTRYKSQIYNQNKQIIEDHKRIAILTNKNANLYISIKTSQCDQNAIYSKYNDLVSKLHSCTATNADITAQLTSVLDNLKSAHANTIKLKDVISNLQTFKSIVAPYVVLAPTWVGSGVGTPAFDGNLMIIIYEKSQNDKSCKESSIIGYLIENTHKQKLCLKTRQPGTFKYQRNEYLLDLLDSQETPDKSRRYCISILKKF